jgi:uncharacterized protein YecE (DUF72 family)
MTKPKIRVGVGGWTYPPWRKTFYPDGLPQSKELEYGSRRFQSLEINATFYSRQSPKSWANWEKTVPDDFQFAVKGSRFIVTRPNLADAEEGLTNFFAQGLDALGSKLGPILWQFAPRRKFDREDIAAFLKLLPRNLEGMELRHAIEPRHESFQDEQFLDLCREHDAAVVYEDHDEYPCIDADTASFRYARLQRMSEDVPTGYDDKALDSFAERTRRWQKDGHDAYIFMINGAKVRAPAAALALQERLGIAPA